MAINAIQAAIRSMTGTERQFNGDLHAYWDQLGIPPGQFAERMVAWKQLPQNAAWIAATEDTDAPEGVDGLWQNGEQGVWYDPSDLSTMFQDASGTTPVYMPGQGQPDCWIGLQLDKRKGLTRGPEMLTNGDFSGGAAGWGVGGADATHVVDLTGGACRYKSGATSPALTVSQGSLSIVAGRWYELTIVVSSWVSGSVKTDSFNGAAPSGLVLASSAGTFRVIGLATSTTSVFSFLRNAANTDLTIDSISVRELPGNHRWQGTATSRPVLSARYNLLTGTESLATQSVTVAATTYTLATGGSGSVTLSGAASGTYASGSRSITCTAGTLTLTVSGGVTQADLRSSTDGIGLPPYQRVIDANTYDTAGFPLYRKPDGVDDWMQTVAVDFSGTDKVTIAAALRKLSDTAGMFLESSADSSTVNGAFGVNLAPGALAGSIGARLRGTASAGANAAGHAAPKSLVALIALDIARGGWALAMSIRVNGTPQACVQEPALGTTVGAGNLGNHSLYFDRRGGTALPSSARDYGTIIVGRLLSGTETAAVEKLLRQKSRAY